MRYQWLLLLNWWHVREERIHLWLARAIPKRLRMWVYTCVFADVMCGPFNDKTPDSVSAMDVYGHVANLDF